MFVKKINITIIRKTITVSLEKEIVKYRLSCSKLFEKIFIK